MFRHMRQSTRGVAFREGKAKLPAGNAAASDFCEKIALATNWTPAIDFETSIGDV